MSERLVVGPLYTIQEQTGTWGEYPVEKGSLAGIRMILEHVGTVVCMGGLLYNTGSIESRDFWELVKTRFPGKISIDRNRGYRRRYECHERAVRPEWRVRSVQMT